MATKQAKHYWTALVLSASLAEAAHAPLRSYSYDAGGITTAGRQAAVWKHTTLSPADIFPAG